MITSKNTSLKLDAHTDGSLKIRVSASRPISEASYTLKDGTSVILEGALSRDVSFASGEAKLADPEIWSVRRPYLYTVYVNVKYDDGTEELIEDRIGFREISSDGKSILLNGTPFYVRGYIRGIHAHDHGDNAKLGEDEYYRKNISEAKKYGFNFIRFHSTVPPESLFRAADELGILVHIELRPELDSYNNLEEMIQDTERLISPEYAAEIVNRLYNHPSLAVYCVGNEIKGNKVADAIQKIRTNVLANDSSRLFVDSCAWGANGRSWVDLDVQHMSYYFPIGKHANMFEDTENLLVAGDADGNALLENGENSWLSRELSFDVPLIAHEVCHYTALRDFHALREKFNKYGTSEPWWVEEELKMIHAKGFDADYPEMYRASKLFQHECWKRAFEAIRSSRLLSGFHFLQFTDTDLYENSNGMVDCFDDECFISPNEVLTFNADRVLLAKISKELLTAGDELIVPVSLSNYAETGEKTADLSYTLTGDEAGVIASGAMKSIKISKCGLYKISTLHISIPENIRSQKLTLRVKLTSDIGLTTENYWNLWVYPKMRAESYLDFTSYESGDCVITDNIEKALNKLGEGKRVCLVYREKYTRHIVNQDMAAPEYAFKATWNRFKPVIWDRGTNYGGICDTELLGKYGFITDKYYSANYQIISEDCDKIILDSFPVPVKNIISGIDKSVRDRFDAYKKCFNLPELQYDRTLRKFSYLFEVGVGNGKLLVCGLNLTALDSCEPSSLAMASFIKSYIASEDFAPETSLSLDELRSYLREAAKEPVKERIMTQFWALDDAPVESARFWEESRIYIDDGTWGAAVKENN